MSSENEEKKLVPQRCRPFQFSLRTMFAITAFVALACAVLFQVPARVAGPTFVLCSAAFAAMLTTILIYGSSYQRTFCIGALFPLAVLLQPVNPVFGFGYVNLLNAFADVTEENLGVIRPFLAFVWASSILVGLLCVAVRWAIERQAQQR